MSAGGVDPRAEDHGRAEPVEIGHHHPALHPSGHLVDEPGQAGIVTEPEDRHLRTEPGDVVEAAHGVGDGPRMRRVIEENRCPVTVVVLQMSRRLAVGHHQHHGLRVGVAAQVPASQGQCVVQVGPLLVDTLETGEFGGGHRPGVAAESDDLQGV